MNSIYPASINPELEEVFQSNWKRYRLTLFSAPCGCGKTTAAHALLAGHTLAEVTGGDGKLADLNLPKNCDVLLVDDLQLMPIAEQQLLCALIESQRDLHFVLLGRGPVPGWLMPYRLAGEMQVFGTQNLLMERVTARKMLESRGVMVTGSEMTDIQRDINGYPVALELLIPHLAPDKPYSPLVLAAVKRELFAYYDESVFRRFPPPLRRLLLDVAPFEQFDVEFAKMVSGNPRAGELMSHVLRDTSMLQFDGVDTCHFWPIFREFLLWEYEHELSVIEQRALYGRAALYYELHDNIARALECYNSAGEFRHVSELLEKNAELHPGIGHYYEMEKYYYALPREEILRSPALMCGMSMLTAMCMDFDESEKWYDELKAYVSRIKRTDSEYSNVRGKLAYLDIALPQRGTHNILEILCNAFRVISEKGTTLPSFSVTSTLPSIMNGGKDFCEWSKKDDVLYATVCKPVEDVLGRDGVALGDCSLCESKFEKGEDVSARLLTLMARLGEIQTRGTPDIEFVVIALLARVQLAQGRTAAAMEALQNIRSKFVESGETRFLGNMDAFICRIHLLEGNTEQAARWMQEGAPRDDVRLRALKRYQYLTRVMCLIAQGDCESALLVLARLSSYCVHCERTMDMLYVRLLMAICHYRLNDDTWRAELDAARDTCREYSFVRPVADFGAAILPLLHDTAWNKEPVFLDKLVTAARSMAIHYPRFLKCESPLLEPLSSAEMQVLKLICHDLSNSEICNVLDIKLPTVKTHVSHILQKLGVSRRSEAKAAAEKLHILQSYS